MSTSVTAVTDFDPVLSEIVYNYELTMNREMGRALVNLSGSFLFVSASDYACGCLDPDGNILTTISWSLQMGFAMSNTVRASIERFGDDLHDGDVIFANDPYEGGGLHSHDVVMVAPVFADGELVMWVGVSAHVTDVGGAVPGGFSVEPMDCYGENLRFTPVKFYDRGKFRGDVLDAFLTNTRAPKQTGIDLKALLGAVWIGRGRLDALLEQHGKDRIKAMHAAQIAASGRAFTERLRDLPDGVYQGAAHMEHDGANDRIYTIRAAVIKDGDQLTVDYTGTDAQSAGALNCTEVGAVGNVIAAIGTVLAPDIPFNQGLLAPVEVIAPPGTLVNAVKPAPISGATVFGAWFGTDAILEAVNYMIGGVGGLSDRRTGPWGSWTFAWLVGPNQYGEPWFWNVFTGGAGGASAMAFRDGENAMMGIQTVDAFTPNIEDYERQSPLLFVHAGLARDTGGVGEFRGGLAPESICIPYEADGWDVTVFQNRLSAPSSSIAGGYPGSGASISFLRGATASIQAAWAARETVDVDTQLDGAEQPPARARGFWLDRKDAYYIRATGGPGYGDPLDRNPVAVAEDVQRGWVSAEMARTAYAVALDAHGRPDAAATTSLRDAERERRRSLPLAGDVLPVGDGSGGRPQDVEPVASARDQSFGEHLGIDAAGLYRCARCRHTFCSNAANWKWWARCEERPVSPEAILNRTVARDDLVFRRYCCPECAMQIDSEVATVGEPPRWSFRPLELWRAERAAKAGAA
jgi:N-methylhydantoinase B